MVHPTGWSVYDVAARSSAVGLEETRLTCGKWRGKKASMPNVEIEVSTESLRGSADTVTRMLVTWCFEPSQPLGVI